MTSLHLTSYTYPTACWYYLITCNLAFLYECFNYLCPVSALCNIVINRGQLTLSISYESSTHSYQWFTCMSSFNPHNRIGLLLSPFYRCMVFAQDYVNAGDRNWTERSPDSIKKHILDCKSPTKMYACLKWPIMCKTSKEFSTVLWNSIPNLSLEFKKLG